MFADVAWIWMLLAVFLVVGLVVHERTGSRLGGVLVLPLLLVYALIDLSVLVVFAVGAIFALLVGGYFYSQRLYYGRRLLYVFLLSGLASSFALVPLIEPNVGTIVMALLPGLFAYNLHREGRFLEGVSTFMIWFGILLSSVTVLVWLLTNPEVVSRLEGSAGAVLGSLLGAVGGLSPWLAEGLGSIVVSIAQQAQASAATFQGAWASLVPYWEGASMSAREFFSGTLGLTALSGMTLITVATAHSMDGGVE
jgi:hypothetical protein